MKPDWTLAYLSVLHADNWEDMGVFAEQVCQGHRRNTVDTVLGTDFRQYLRILDFLVGLTVFSQALSEAARGFQFAELNHGFVSMGIRGRSIELTCFLERRRPSAITPHGAIAKPNARAIGSRSRSISRLKLVNDFPGYRWTFSLDHVPSRLEDNEGGLVSCPENDT